MAVFRETETVCSKIICLQTQALAYISTISSTHGGRSWASALRGSSVLCRTRQPPLPFFPHFLPLISAIQMIRRYQAASAIRQLFQDDNKIMLMNPDVSLGCAIAFLVIPIQHIARGAGATKNH